MSKITAAITGVQGYLPETILSNHDLAQMVDTTDEWILTRTGISERRIMKNGASSDMGAEAVKALLAKKGIDPLDIELVIVATVTPDHPFPSTANIICDKVGMTNAWGFDLIAACSGFIYAASLMGVTGTRDAVSGNARSLVERIRKVSKTPVAVGLGVSTKTQAQEVAQYADGVIVGSAFIKIIQEHGSGRNGLKKVKQLAKSLSEGVRNAS